MSTAKGRTNGHFSLASYRAQATGDPFVFDVDDDKTITIPRPTGDQMFKAEEAMRTGLSRKVIEALCGDVASELLKILGTEDAGVMKQLGDDMASHFGLGE